MPTSQAPNIPGRGAQAPAASDRWRLVKAIGGLVAACMVGLVAGVVTALLTPADWLAKPTTPVSDKAARPVNEFDKLPKTSIAAQLILLLGSDEAHFDRLSTKDAPVRSDTMLLLGVHPGQRRFTALWIPRDTRCEIPGHGQDKINAALALGGPQLACQTVANFLRVPIDHWIQIKIAGLIDLVDRLGGVDIEVPKNMHYTDRTAGLAIRLKKGLQHLDGEKAHEFIRFRHDAQGDIGRISRQQAFLQAIAHKLLSPAGILALPRLIAIFHEVIATDMDLRQLMTLA
ncbi:MAG: LCP family protein, partial [Cyanobacteria bacterium NC_groundwater_1444_Ag_S-0.65um_54_12]|nr:LCP family protein [Cyanobacteria bacterium NC_groundwater_1444_Ag_S-0.65um_54_12]